MRWQRLNAVIIGLKNNGFEISLMNKTQSYVRTCLPSRSCEIWSRRNCLSGPEKSGVGASLRISQIRYKHSEIDTSKVPVLNEDEVEEWYTKGSGPGGSNVNKRTNACVLRHIPSGILVKCHLSRLLQQNQKLARQMMVEKLDIFYNGDDSVVAQKERLSQKRLQTKDLKSQKIRELKMRYKDTVNNEKNDNDDKSNLGS